MKNIQKTKDSSSSDFDTFKYNKYMSVYPFNDKRAFNSWLEINNLTKEEFLSWFDESKKESCLKEGCPWMDYLLYEYKPTKNLNGLFNNGEFGFFIDFFILRGKNQINHKLLEINSKHDKFIKPEIFVKLFTEELLSTLLGIVTPTLKLELNVARISGSLIGESSELRFKHYIKLLQEKDFKAKTFKEYPLLFERLVAETENSINEYVEFYSRLTTDFIELTQKFGDLGKFITHRGDKGDSHNNGRFVRVCRFEKTILVYKPRSLFADSMFQKLLLDINHVANTSFSLSSYLDKGKYGWSEFIEFRKCTNQRDYKKYYETMGEYIALLYILNSNDFHFENVISQGKNPILIDLETVIHSEKNNYAFNQFDNVHTVLESYLIPQYVKVASQENKYDFSAIGFNENQTIKVSNEGHKKITRDDVSFEKIEIQLQPNKLVHSLENEFSVSLDKIIHEISKGFKKLYSFFLNNEEWLGYNFNYQQMVKAKFRSILRPTNVYAALIEKTNHPDLLRNNKDQFLYLTNKLWVAVKKDQSLKKVFKYELECIIKGNVPIFNYSPNSKSLICGSGLVIDGFFKHKTQDKIFYIQKSLSTKDLTRQTWLINASLLAQKKPNRTIYLPIKTNKHKDSSELVDSVSQKLLDISFDHGNGYRWMNWELDQEKFEINNKKNYELFGGNIGTLLYLAYYAKIKNNGVILRHVNKSLELSLDNLSLIDEVNIGGFGGLGGLIYALSRIYKITHNNLLIKYINKCHSKISGSIKADQSFDIISGSSGCILSLVSAFKIVKNSKYLKTADICAKHLIENIQILKNGAAWKNINSNNRLLGGFSHGVTGVGYSLAVLSNLMGESKYQKYIDYTFDYEDSLYDCIKNNYLDLREDDCCLENHSDYFGWCNGSLGIGIARLDLLINNIQPKRTYQFKSEIKNHISKIVDLGLIENDSLCHGNASILEYLFLVSNYYPQYYNPKDFRKMLEKMKNRVFSKGIRNGTFFNLFDPGLMLGSIGLAYQLLRVDNPKIVGNILLLK